MTCHFINKRHSIGKGLSDMLGNIIIIINVTDHISMFSDHQVGILTVC